MISRIRRNAMRVLSAVFGITLCFASMADAQQPKTAYILAGQSNLAYWGFPQSSGSGSTLSNVQYVEAVYPFTRRSYAGSALMAFGYTLGASDSSRDFEIYQIAVGGSALYQYVYQTLSNSLVCPGYWLKPLSGPDQSLTKALAPALVEAGKADVVKIVWCQGETDQMLPYWTINYAADALQLFENMRVIAGNKSQVEVFLVTPGVTQHPSQPNADVDRTRDQYRLLPWLSAATSTPCRIVAHHYDMPIDTIWHHTGFYHLMAGRVAEGILDPSRYFDYTGTYAFNLNGQSLALMLSHNPAIPGPVAPRFFEIVVSNGTPHGAVSTNGNWLIIPFASPLPSGTQVTVRHVHGSGYNLGWHTALPVYIQPVPTQQIVPLAPFVMTATAP